MSERLLSFDKYLDSVRRNRINYLALLLSLCCFLPLAGYTLWGKSYFSDATVFFGGNALNLIVSLATFQVSRKASVHFTQLHPESDQSVYRVSLWFILYTVITISALFTLLSVYHKLRLFGYQLAPAEATWSAVFLVSGSLIAAGLTELAYTFAQWGANQDELQQLEQRQLQTELEAVKQQVNPHFLFNCLNSLSVLISEAPATAEKFVDEMSKVYRYLLSVNGPEKEDMLVTLESEVRFIKSYIYLLETRYEAGIKVNLQIADLYLCGQLAPLTIQTLIDNAIRHNTISIIKPLEINIRTTPTGQLEVNNNVQKRIVRMPFNAASLATLTSRYRLLFNHAGKIQVQEDDSSFTVILPLIFT